MQTEEGWRWRAKNGNACLHFSSFLPKSQLPKMPVTQVRNKKSLKRDTAVQLGMRDIPETHCWCNRIGFMD